MFIIFAKMNSVVQKSGAIFKFEKIIADVLCLTQNVIMTVFVYQCTNISKYYYFLRKIIFFETCSSNKFCREQN